MLNNTPYIKSHSNEVEVWNSLSKKLAMSSIPKNELIANLPLFLTRQTLMRMEFFRTIYMKILNVHGVVMEFGCKWGTNLSLMSNFRGIYEPYNHNRKIIGFDTFQGLCGTSGKDGHSKHIQEGFYSTTQDYQDELSEILNLQQEMSPISHIKKFDVIAGDVRQTLPAYLQENPQTVIAFAYFDMDIYEPTFQALNMIKPYLTKGSIIVCALLIRHRSPDFRYSLDWPT